MPASLMKKIIFLFALCTLIFAPVAVANPVACTAILCLSNVGPPPSECRTARLSFFQLTVYSPVFNPPATAALRSQYLMTCGAGQQLVPMIAQKYMIYPTDPGI
jgi:hypothetical protein